MFRFEEPAYLYLLLAVPALLALYVFSIIKKNKSLRLFGDPILMAALMPEVSGIRPKVKVGVVLTIIALFAVLLARPQFGSTLETVKRQGVEVMIALDISNSMLAQDIKPSRLEKAKRIVSQLVDKMEDDKIGLIVFAGDAFTQLPITSDFISAKMFLETITPSLINKQGTDIAAAIKLANNSFTGQENIGKAIIVITDGENHEGGVDEAVSRSVEKGLQVNVLGVGTPDGSLIPIGDNSNEFKRDKDGNAVVSKLNEQMCQDLARKGNGVYVRVDNTNAAQKTIQAAIDKLAKKDIESQVYTDYNEQFQAIAWIVLILLLFELFFMDKKNPLFKNIHLFSKK